MSKWTAVMIGVLTIWNCDQHCLTSKPMTGTVRWSLPMTPSCVVLEGRDGMEKDLDRLKRWACASLVKFNQAKCKVLHWDRSNPKHKFRLGRDWIESSPVEKDSLGKWVDGKLDIPWPCASGHWHPEAPVCWADTMAWAAVEGGVLLLCAALVGLHLQSCLQLWVQHQDV